MAVKKPAFVCPEGYTLIRTTDYLALTQYRSGWPAEIFASIAVANLAIAACCLFFGALT